MRLLYQVGGVISYLHHEPEVLVDLCQEKDAGKEERGGDREEQLGEEERFLLQRVSGGW